MIPARYRVHAFYYLWYNEPSTGGWAHWDHAVLPHWDPATAAKYPQGIRFEPPDCLHSPFYPLRGPYSSTSQELIRQHLEEMTKYGIGILVASWWGPGWRQGSHDTQMINTDDRIEQVIKEIEATSSPVRVAFHLEPYEGRTKQSVHEDLVYLSTKYRDSPAVARVNGRILYYVYDSYRLPASDWAELLVPNTGPLNVRGTAADGFFLGLWLEKDDGDKNILPGGFDGFYTYFSSEATSYASNPANWPDLQGWARAHQRIFVPSLGPGYHDGKIRPWNMAARREREGSDRYKRLWDQAINLGVHFVSITSYNEWGEGTQVEPAVPRPMRQDCAYLDYEPHSPFEFLRITYEGGERLAAAVNRAVAEARQAARGGREGEEEEEEEEDEYADDEDDGDGPGSGSCGGGGPGGRAGGKGGGAGKEGGGGTQDEGSCGAPDQ
ncbi:hypothetical protein HYH02_006794 [Chlamydomonas schloesseri]|uniref:Glycoprotein endo-alpha-1,2-mannosidase-like protein n=1 Tax=Chlamydomonas schloesseri TaxID=2026947 RepID=A0A836B5Z0_9CHLO|nr:hypothetical protein HYH02_006794 [Chlamydomonas schloesseri]|eukprot:KAG2448209.1 hypothetical protein HYH02_006794 [Chlamydomonas schloesseri]